MNRAHRKNSAQIMIITVLILGGTILGSSAIAGLITNYRLRQSSDAKDSALAIFAADAGLEKAMYQCFKLAQPFPDCATFGPELLPNGATYKVIYADNGTYKEIRSRGVSKRTSRALQFRF